MQTPKEILFPAIFILLACSIHTASSQTPDASTKLRLAQGFEQAGDYERAATLYKELFSRDSLNIVYFDGLQRMFMQLKQYDAAVALIRNRLSVTPGDVNLRGMLGTVYYRWGKENEAKAEWDAALALNPANPNYYRMIASAILENRLLDKAAEIYRRGRIACHDQGLFTLELAQLLAVSMDYEGATTEYIRWLEQNPAQISFVQNKMSAFTWKEDARTAAIEAVRTTLRHDDDVRLHELLGWLYLEAKRVWDAYDVYRQIDRLTHAQGVELYSFAERAFNERAFDVAAQAYQEAIDSPLPGPKLPYAKYGYANALRELSAAADTLQGPLISSASPATESSPRYSGAIAYYKKIIDEYPHSEFSAKSYYQIGRIQFEKYFDLDGALSSFERVRQELHGANLIACDVSLKMGEICTARGDTARAASMFRGVADDPAATPDQTDEANLRLAELDYFGGRFAAAIERLDVIMLNMKADYANDAIQLRTFLEENSGTAPAALTQFARADFLARQRKNTEAIVLYRNLIEQFARVPIADDALFKIAMLQEASGFSMDAIASYQKLLMEFKETCTALDRAQFHIAEIYHLRLKDSTKAAAAYEQLLVDFPRSVFDALARKRIRQLRGETL